MMNSDCWRGTVATIFSASLAVCSVGLVGCGNELGRLPVSGKITLDNQPLDYGSIEFYPKDSKGVSAGSVIASDGTYEISEKKGLPPGDYSVRIFSAFEEDADAHLGPGVSDFVSVERIPEEYNANSTHVVTVAKENENIFDFDILSKK